MARVYMPWCCLVVYHPSSRAARKHNNQSKLVVADFNRRRLKTRVIIFNRGLRRRAARGRFVSEIGVPRLETHSSK